MFIFCITQSFKKILTSCKTTKNSTVAGMFFSVGIELKLAETWNMNLKLKAKLWLDMMLSG